MVVSYLEMKHYSYTSLAYISFVDHSRWKGAGMRKSNSHRQQAQMNAADTPGS